MRLLRILIPLLIILAVFSNCAQEKYGDVKAVLKDMIKVQEKYIDDIKKADSAAKCAAAINTFAESIKEFKSKKDVLDKKYPELQSAKEIPQELKGIMDELVLASQKMMEASQGLEKYANDPEVQKAIAKMAQLGQ